MKGVITAVVGTLAVFGGAAAGAYWYGNQPVKEYYPNGAIKSITERKMFENTGKYQLFAQDGAKILEYNQEKGIKNGGGELFFADGTVSFNFQNNKLSGPLSINSQKYAEYLSSVKFDVNNSELNISGWDVMETTAAISCSENDFLMNTREFLNNNNYASFKAFFGCLNFNKATFVIEGGKCTYEGAYQFPNYLADTKAVCEVTNTDFLEGYAEGFNMLSDISAGISEANGTISLNAGHLADVEKFKFENEYKIADKKFSFAATTVSENATIEQKGSFGGLEKIFEDGIEFAYSAQSENDVKKFILSLLQNMSWADWEATINGRKRFTINGDFNFLNGFSNPYVMSYYSNNEVTTQWKIDDKGMQLTSKYPNTNTPLFSFGMSINDGFKKAYKSLVQDGLSMAMGGGANFNPAIMNRLQNEAVALVKGINSFSSVLMNEKGEKTISGAVAIQKNFNLEQFMTSPLQFLNFKVVTYQGNKPFKVYEGNMEQGFKLNGQPLPPEQYESEIEYLIDVLKNSFEGIMAELEKVYGDLDENQVNWIDSDIDPFLFGLYKGYTFAGEQFGFDDEDYGNNTVADEIEMIVVNTKIMFKENPKKYGELNNETASSLGIVPTDENNSPVNSFGGKIVVRTSAKEAADPTGAFMVAFSSVPDEECEQFLSEDLLSFPREGLIGISVGNMSAAPKGFAEVNKMMTDNADNAGNADAAQGYIAAKTTQIDELITDDNVDNICSGGEMGNFIVVKYY